MSHVPGAAMPRRAALLAAALLACAVLTVPQALANPSGGVAARSVEPGEPAAPPAAATLSASGRALAPDRAPARVRRAIAAANRISARPYVWGGGHRGWRSHGYDCSGAVSFALHGGGFLHRPLDSGSLMRWGAPGPGRWVTIYTNRHHAYATIAGLRWDTAGDRRGVSGPRWHRAMAKHAGFVLRHPPGY